MNKEELKELGETLIGISRGEPWQVFSDSEWRACTGDAMKLIVSGYKIRLKPWELTDTVNGHTLPPGASWHRQDFTEDMLPDGHRPLMLGETGEYQWLGLDGWKEGKAIGDATRATHSHTRTTRPIPSALTPERISEGWIPWSGGECPVELESIPTVMFIDAAKTDRKAKEWSWMANGEYTKIIAYRPDPYGHLRQALADGRVIEYQPSVGSHWHQLDSADKIGFIAPPEAYRIKEQQWLPLGPEDFPPGSVVKKK